MNLKTFAARQERYDISAQEALGLNVPDRLLVAADEVIE
jgi:hypothetical protein